MTVCKIQFASAKCVGCGACVTACIDQNDTDIAHGQRPRRHIAENVTLIGDKVCLNFSSKACRHCNPAPCQQACPENCFIRSPNTNFVLLETKDCIHCGCCVSACPFQAIATHHGHPDKCDGCDVRVQFGMLPACVRTCITGALTLRSDG